jgi:hypothetical protein
MRDIQPCVCGHSEQAHTVEFGFIPCKFCLCLEFTPAVTFTPENPQ